MFDFAVGSDHGGVELKNYIVGVLSESYEVKDFGTDSDKSVDYPDIGFEVAEFVSKQKAKRGILVCGTGIGMSIVANRLYGVRAALCHDEFSARLSREHNNSNVLVLGGRVLGYDLARAILDTWVNTEFSGGRHQRRLDKIDAIEGSNK